jgi:AmmeMemoRadiSam system protein B
VTSIAQGRGRWAVRLAAILGAAVVAALVATAIRSHAQAVLHPPQDHPPTLEETRKGMGIPSQSLALRGQRDSIGFAWNAEQMAKVWELSASPPAPESFGTRPAPGVAAVICPHDDYLYAGRVYRQVLPLITARTVILIGVFHRYRSFGERDRLVFDPYRAWRTPDGPVPVSNLREILTARLTHEDFVQDAAMHDSEHSLEALVYWLRHRRPDLEIVPIIVPVASFERLEELADKLGLAIAVAIDARGLRLGRDVAVAISTDGIHYGPDFKQTTFGEGGQKAYDQAVAKDRSLMTGPLKGPLTRGKIKKLYETFVDPKSPDDYRWTWCGRFSVPFGLLTVRRIAEAFSARAIGTPVAYGTSMSAPELPVKELGIGATAPASLSHFVGYPAAAFTIGAGDADTTARDFQDPTPTPR